MQLQCQGNEKHSNSDGPSTDQLKDTPKVFKSYLCNRYARKRAHDNEMASNNSLKKLTEEEAQLSSGQSDNRSVPTVPSDGEQICKGGRQTDFDELESWAQLQSPNLLAAGNDLYCVGELVQGPCVKLSPATGGEGISQSVLPPLTRVLDEQEMPLPIAAVAASSPDTITLSDWEDDLDTLLCEEDDSDCSGSDGTDVPLSPGDLTFTSQFEMDTDTEEGEGSQQLQLTWEHGTAIEDPLQATANLQECNPAALSSCKIANHAVPETGNTILDDFDCLDSCAFFNEGESEDLLSRDTKRNCYIAPRNSNEQCTQWSGFNVRENDFQW